MGQAQTHQPEMGLNFEKVWAMFQDTDKKFQETREKMKETDRKISKLGSRIGQLIEQLTASNILEKFNCLGYEFTRVSRNHIIEDGKGRFLAEIDLLLEDGECAMVVEVKSLLSLSDVKDHLKKLKTIREYADNHNDKRKYAGAVAGALVNKNARETALKSGMYIVEQSGDTVQIKAPEKPHFW